jgi:hypothetical protein
LFDSGSSNNTHFVIRRLATLIDLIDRRRSGAETWHWPRRKHGGQVLDVDARTYNMLLRALRCLGERGFALLTQHWRTLQHINASPSKIGDIIRAALVLVATSHTAAGYRPGRGKRRCPAAPSARTAS